MYISRILHVTIFHVYQHKNNVDTVYFNFSQYNIQMYKYYEFLLFISTPEFHTTNPVDTKLLEERRRAWSLHNISKKHASCTNVYNVTTDI